VDSDRGGKIHQRLSWFLRISVIFDFAFQSADTNFMDSEKKLPKSSVLPARKSKVFQKEPETRSDSPIWVPPSFAPRGQQASSENGRTFKLKKPSFIPKTTHPVEAPPEDATPLESRPLFEDFQMASTTQERLSPKISPVWVASILAGALICFLLVGWLAYHQGFSASQKRLNELRMELPPAIPPEFQASIDSALKAYNKGNAADAVEILSGVYRKNQTIPSTCYLMALTAIQSGNLQIASEKVDESIFKGERLSDSLALKAAIEMEKSNKGGMGDPKVRAESLLRSAMAADVSNPRPYIELASLLRFQGRNDEARQLFEAASVRLNPVEGQALVDTSLSLLNLQQTPDDKLPVNLDSDKDPRSLVSAAYAAMRKNDIPAVKALLAKARDRLSPPLYDYLMNDPAIRVFSKNPQMSGLF
jgi:tetratricopeptide (TPR) repeat protein